MLVSLDDLAFEFKQTKQDLYDLYGATIRVNRIEGACYDMDWNYYEYDEETQTCFGDEGPIANAFEDHVYVLGSSH